MSQPASGTTGRILAGFLIAPLATVLGIYGGFAACYLLGVNPVMHTPGDAMSNATSWVVFAVPLAYLVEFCVALPVHRWFARSGRTDLRAYLLTGAVSGAAPFVGMAGLVALSAFRGHADRGWFVDVREVRYWLTFLYFGPLCGIASATLFWLIGVRSWRLRRRSPA